MKNALVPTLFRHRTYSSSIHIRTGCVLNLKDSPTPYQTVHRTVWYPRFARAGLSSPISAQKMSRPKGAAFWGAFYKFRFHPHPYGMRLESEGLSHGLRKCPPDTFLPSLRSGRPFESHLSHQKKAAPKGQLFGVLFINSDFIHIPTGCVWNLKDSPTA